MINTKFSSLIKHHLILVSCKLSDLLLHSMEQTISNKRKNKSVKNAYMCMLGCCAESLMSHRLYHTWDQVFKYRSTKSGKFKNKQVECQYHRHKTNYISQARVRPSLKKNKNNNNKINKQTNKQKDFQIDFFDVSKQASISKRNPFHTRKEVPKINFKCRFVILVKWKSFSYVITSLSKQHIHFLLQMPTKQQINAIQLEVISTICKKIRIIKHNVEVNSFY